jgi:hypothetical protein
MYVMNECAEPTPSLKRRRPVDEEPQDDDDSNVIDDPSEWQPFWSYLDEMRKTGTLDAGTDMLVVQVRACCARANTITPVWSIVVPGATVRAVLTA